MTNVDRAALAALILFSVFIAYEIAGGASFFPDLHTVSYYAYRMPWLKWTLLVVPPAIYMIWWLHHMSRFVPK